MPQLVAFGVACCTLNLHVALGLFDDVFVVPSCATLVVPASPSNASPRLASSAGAPPNRGFLAAKLQQTARP